jgi:hypothetical protein
MNIFAKSLISKHMARFNQGQTSLLEKRRQWIELVETAKQVFESIEFEINNQQFFEKLYMIDTASLIERSGQLPSIQFSFGQHSVGYKNSNNILCMECECTLQITLLLDGAVCCVLYPFKSDMHQRNEKYLIVKIVTSPCELTEANIKKLFVQLFSYAQISSVLGSPTWEDKITLYKLIGCHYRYHFKIKNLLPGFRALLIPIARLNS